MKNVAVSLETLNIPLRTFGVQAADHCEAQGVPPDLILGILHDGERPIAPTPALSRIEDCPPAIERAARFAQASLRPGARARIVVFVNVTDLAVLPCIVPCMGDERDPCVLTSGGGAA